MLRIQSHSPLGMAKSVELRFVGEDLQHVYDVSRVLDDRCGWRATLGGFLTLYLQPQMPVNFCCVSWEFVSISEPAPALSPHLLLTEAPAKVLIKGFKTFPCQEILQMVCEVQY